MSSNESEKKDCPTAVESLKLSLSKFFDSVKESATTLSTLVSQKIQAGVSMMKQNAETIVDTVNNKLSEAKTAALNVGERVEENIKSIASSVAEPKTIELLKRMEEQLRTSHIKLADEIKQHIEELDVSKVNAEKAAKEATDATAALSAAAIESSERVAEESKKNNTNTQKYYKYKNKYMQLKNTL